MNNVSTPQVITLRFVSAYYKLYSMGVVKTRVEYSRNCGLHKSNFCDMEKGKRLVPLQALCQFLNYYNVSPAWLFAGEGDFLNAV